MSNYNDEYKEARIIVKKSVWEELKYIAHKEGYNLTKQYINKILEEYLYKQNSKK